MEVIYDHWFALIVAVVIGELFGLVGIAFCKACAMSPNEESLYRIKGLEDALKEKEDALAQCDELISKYQDMEQAHHDEIMKQYKFWSEQFNRLKSENIMLKLNLRGIGLNKNGAKITLDTEQHAKLTELFENCTKEGK